MYRLRHLSFVNAAAHNQIIDFFNVAAFRFDNLGNRIEPLVIDPAFAVAVDSLNETLDDEFAVMAFHVEQIPPDHFRIVAVRNINSIQIIRKSIQIAIVELRIGAIPEPGKYPLLAVIAYPSQ